MSRSTDLHAVLEGKLRDDSLRVPPYPSVATQLQRMADDETSGIRDVSRLVAADAALAALVLKHANAAGVGAGSTATLQVAVSRLGVKEVIRLAVASTVGAAAGALGPLADLRRDLWRRALLSALIAQRIAGGRRISPEVAFLAGLLHDFGAVVVLRTIEEIASTGVLRTQSAESWMAVVDRFSRAAGVAVARRWQLPETIANTLAYHRDPAAAPGPDRPVVEIIAAVDQVIDVLDRVPEHGVSALAQITALSADEHQRIAAALPAIASHVMSFETCLPPAKAVVVAPTLVAKTERPRTPRPLDLVVDVKGSPEPMRAVAISDAAIELVGRTPLRADWIATLTLHGDRGPTVMATTVESCSQHRDGFRIVARPFGLAPAERAAWRQLVERARIAA